MHIGLLVKELAVCLVILGVFFLEKIKKRRRG